MLEDEIIKRNIGNTLGETNFSNLGEKIPGKVRDNYVSDDKRFLVATDRISCFDRIVGTIPFKGQLLTQMAVWWFDQTKDIAPNHILDFPDPSVVVAKECKPIPVEMVIRGYITGSLWRDYESGKRDMYGLDFQNDLQKNQKLDAPILTPTTKAEYGEHDMPISREEIIEKGVVDADIYGKLEDYSLKLFARGTELAAKNGLILVDTKYEFGLDSDGNITVIDEIHTPDSSRYWKEGATSAFDKEYVREWLRQNGFSGDGEAPELADEVKVEACKKYIYSYETITGREFTVDETPIQERIQKNLKEKNYL